jgi:lysophospholipase L1-like esterase
VRFGWLRPADGNAPNPPSVAMQRLRAALINASLVIGSLCVFLLLCEYVVFRFVWLASDVPRLDFVDGVIRYAPDQSGVWRVRDEIAAPFAINGQGWNSGIGDYVAQRRPGTTRLALVGDSYVEALQVPNTESAAEVLGRTLTQHGHPAEVYRFGISGAALSQYTYMVEREVLRYKPDWIIVNVVHNDFDESYRFVQGRYTSSFNKYRIVDGEVRSEIPPTPWRSGAIEKLRETATARFLLYRWGVRPTAVVNFFLPRQAADTPRAGNVNIKRILAERREVEAVADYAVRRLVACAHQIGARLLVVMDGDRQAVYRGTDSPALELNRIMAAAAARHGVAFLDLHPVFAAHWAAHRQSLNFGADGHWNELAHSIVGAAIASRIEQIE